MDYLQKNDPYPSQVDDLSMPEKPRKESFFKQNLYSEIPDSEVSQVHPKGEFLLSWPFAEGGPGHPKYKLYLADRKGEETYDVDLDMKPNGEESYFRLKDSKLRTRPIRDQCILTDPI